MLSLLLWMLQDNCLFRLLLVPLPFQRLDIPPLDWNVIFKWLGSGKAFAEADLVILDHHDILWLSSCMLAKRKPGIGL